MVRKDKDAIGIDGTTWKASIRRPEPAIDGITAWVKNELD